MLVRWCADLLGTRVAYGDPAQPEVGWLAGRVATTWGAPEHLADGAGDYWPRVWAARTLLYVWDPLATRDLVAALGDPSWRVREMCLKVAIRWEVADGVDVAGRLVADEVVRVRVAALRVLGAVGEHEHLALVDGARDDTEPSVAVAAERARHLLCRRLDLPA